MKALINIGIQAGTKLLRIQRQEEQLEDKEIKHGKFVPFLECGHWIIWLATSDYIYGTFLRLYDDGRIERVTVRNDEPDDVMLIKPRDGT